MRLSRKLIVALVALTATAGAYSAPPTSLPTQQPHPSIKVLFTPEDNCTKAIVQELNGATQSIRVQAYVLTSDPIGAALVAAKRRSVAVEVILDSDRTRREGAEAEQLVRNGVRVLVDGAHYYAHNKIMIIDESTVLTGSFNFSEKAEAANAENLLIIKGFPDVTRRYVENWEAHAKHSPPFVSRDEPVPGGGQIVYAGKEGKRYHRKNCQHVRPNTPAITREQAIKKGKSPCKVCRPD